jgi:hypothetical protein
MEIYFLKAIKQGRIHVTYFKYKVKVFNIKIIKYQIQLQFQFKIFFPALFFDFDFCNWYCF